VHFDLDETLTDRAKSIVKFASEFLRRFGGDLSDGRLDDVTRVILAGDGHGYASREVLAESIRSLDGWKRKPGVEELVRFWREAFPACNVEREGARKVLETLRGRGVKLGVITNGLTWSQNTKLEAMGLREFFSVVLISEEVGIRKPDARIFMMGLDGLGVDASDAVFVGDNPELDIAGARGVGMRAIWLNSDQEEIEGVQRITSFDQLLPLLENPPSP
jgi:putative hydrolase of the HAD superfamily